MVCVLTTMLPSGEPHSAVVHYSHTENPFVFFIQTKNDTVKVQSLLSQEIGKASMVIGLSEDEWVTFQMRGDIRIVSDAKEREYVSGIHHTKHPFALKRQGPTTIFLEFKPTWWRYTNFTTKPVTTIEIM